MRYVLSENLAATDSQTLLLGQRTSRSYSQRLCILRYCGAIRQHTHTPALNIVMVRRLEEYVVLDCHSLQLMDW